MACGCLLPGPNASRQHRKSSSTKLAARTIRGLPWRRRRENRGSGSIGMIGIDGPRAALAVIGVVAALCFRSTPGLAETPPTIAVADFDYIDTSGETKDQRAAHQARMAQSAKLLRAKLSAQEGYRVLPFESPNPPSTPINMQ